MADVKISNLTALTAVADADEFVIVDSGTTKKITRKNLLGTADVTLDNNIVLTGGGTISTTSNGDIALMPNGTGKIGIGIAAPVCPLDIRHAGTGEGESIVVGNAGEGTYGGFGYDNDSPYPAIIWGAEVNIRTGSSRLSGATTRMVVDANSRISLSNNDSGGTGGTDSTSGNTLLGYLAGEDIASGGYENTLIGHGAGKNIDTGDKNVMIGSTAGDAIDGETNNVGIGYGAMGGAVNGADKCIAIGSDSLSGAITQDGTIAIGHDTLAALTSGAGNVAVGYQAGLAQTDSYYNTSIGHQANKVTDANSNTAVGYLAHQGDGSDNTAIGVLAMDNASGQADGCVAIGKDALRGDLTSAADGTVAIGMDALTALTTGAKNMGIGYLAGAVVADGTDNTLIGYQSGYQTTYGITSGDHNTALGSSTLGASAAAHITGSGNTAIGSSSMLEAQGAVGNNTAVGKLSLGNLTLGTENTALGFQAARQLGVSEVGNVAVGANALNTFDEGTNGNINYNIAIGVEAFIGGNLDTASTNVIGNIAIGAYALDATSTNAQTGTIAIGHQALTALTSGARNLAIGYQAAEDLTVGDDNIAIGYLALNGMSTDGNADQNIAIGNYVMDVASNTASTRQNVCIGHNSGTLLTGDDNTCIGNASGDTMAAAEQNTIIGSGADTSASTTSNATAIGYGAVTQGNNSVTLGNASVTAVYMASDKGAKVYCGQLEMGTTGTGNVGIGVGSDMVYYSYLAGTSAQQHMIFNNDNGDVGSIDSSGSNTSYGTTSDYRLKENQVTLSDGINRLNKLKPYRFNFKADKDTTQDGFFAHEVAEVVPEAITGEKDAVDGDGNMITQHIDHSKLVPLLVKAVQELSAKVEALENAE